MAHCFIGEGTEHSYDELIAQLEEGHMLVATWLLSSIHPTAETVRDKAHFEKIITNAKHGYNVELRFFSSSHKPEHFLEYNNLTEDGEKDVRPFSTPIVAG